MLAPAQPTFFYDLGSPRCYLVAERISSSLPVVAEWEPVSAAALGIEIDAEERPDVERQAGDFNLQQIRWPPSWPPDTRIAMLAATYAKRIGRVVSFSLAAFRQEFAGGRDLSEQESVLIAGAASEMHPSALLKGMSLRSVADALGAANERARRAGAEALPAIALDGVVYAGEDPIAEAAKALGAAA